MILGVSGFIGSPGGGDAIESGAGSGGSSDVGASSSIPGGIAEESERSGGGGVGRGGSRWPRQETLALLKIRSDMDAAFRDASLKAPLWEEVSRKMAELGFQRSTKKCKEKFENVFKYHKRTKDGRAVKPDGKSYRFFDQLEALENNTTNLFTPPPPPRPPATAAMTAQVNFQNPPLSSSLPTSPTPLNILHPNISQFQPSQPPLQPPPTTSIPHSFHHISASLISNTTSSSSTSSDEDIQRPRGRKRKWKDYLESLMREVIQKQEDLQKKFLETLEKRERDRISREDAWRLQEMARMNREHEIMVQERSIAAAKDAAVIAFLQKAMDQQHISPKPMPMPMPMPVSITLPPQMPIQVQPVTNPPPLRPTITDATAVVTAIAPTHLEIAKRDNGGDSFALTPSSSSRWPKAEVQALIKLRTNLDLKYQENVPKGPLWEEISSAMAKLGYNRSSKRCKEKWENINKYYKKVKESSKKRPEDSKTCPYFHQLDAIYRERAKPELLSLNPGFTTKQDNTMAPIMARPEQQWPQQDKENQGINHDDDDVDDDDEEEEEEGEGGGYRIITNHQPTAQGER